MTKMTDQKPDIPLLGTSGFWFILYKLVLYSATALALVAAYTLDIKFLFSP